MRIFHLNCASLRPVANMLANGLGHLLRQQPIPAHCLLIDTGQVLVLVDSGIGLGAIASPRSFLGTSFLRVSRPQLDPNETAIRQIQRLGYDAADVRHIVLTHLDADHVGGIADFPHAKVHVYGPELRAAEAPATRLDRLRYRPALWAHGPQWVVHQPAQGDRWFGFDAVRSLEGLPEDILLIPLPGHAVGQVGVAVDTGTSWLLHAGDAYNMHSELHRNSQRNPAVLLTQLAQGKTYRHNQNRLSELLIDQAGKVTVFCAHDATELQRLRDAAADGTGQPQHGRSTQS